MSFQITEAFVQQYKDNVLILAQQKGSRLRGRVRVRDGVVGKRTSFERIGVTAPQKRVTRHADTPLMETPHSRRWANLEDWEWADLVDELDRIRMLINPDSEYAINAGYGMGRQMDTIIIDAIRGTAVTGEEASGTQALPSGQKLSLGDGGDNALNIGKLRLAKTKLDKAEIESEGRVLVVSAEGIRQLLETTEVTSSDFNTIKALVQGDINTFLGFDIVRTEVLPFSTGTQRLGYAFQKNSIGLAMGKDVMTRITERADKSYSMQIYLCMALGAIRIQDTGVVEIVYDEAV